MLKCYKNSFLVISVFFLSFVLLSCVAKKQYNLKEPSAADDSHIWDFGQVKEGEVLEHAFILINFQDRPMIITNMHTSCGCTVSQAQKKHLLPGEQAQINVKFHTQGYSGKVEQHVYVHTDDAREPIVKFTLKGEVVK